CIGSVLCGTTETPFPRRRPRDHISLFVGKGNDDVVERCNNMRLSSRFYDYFTLFSCCFGTCLCHTTYLLFSCFFLVGNCFPFSFSGPRVVLGTLTSKWQSISLTNSTVTSYVHKSHDFHLGL